MSPSGPVAFQFSDTKPFGHAFDLSVVGGLLTILTDPSLVLTQPSMTLL